MGEATYYAKIKFQTEEEAEEHYPLLRQILLDIYQAQEYWQRNRFKLANDDEFWKGMEAYPHATEYLKFTEHWKCEYHNGLAGVLDVLGSETDIRNLEQHGTEIWWDSLVWHFADWSLFEAFITEKWDCQMSWVSDEYIDPFDLITFKG